MKVLNPNPELGPLDSEVELTPDEKAANEYFNQQLDLGQPVPEALRKTKNLWPLLDPKFYAWLSQ